MRHEYFNSVHSARDAAASVAPCSYSTSILYPVICIWYMILVHFLWHAELSSVDAIYLLCFIISVSEHTVHWAEKFNPHPGGDVSHVPTTDGNLYMHKLYDYLRV